MRFRPASIWRRVVFRWHARERGAYGFVAMALLPVAALTSIIAFAYSSRTTVDESARLDAARIRAREIRCLAENIYHEGRGEPLEGQYAIAEVTMNRVRSRHYPNTICEVVHDTRWDPIRRRFVGHFSWTEIEDLRDPWGPAWEQAVKVATAVYGENYMPVVPEALHYHAVTVQPYWARSKRTVARIGNHIFYR